MKRFINFLIFILAIGFLVWMSDAASAQMDVMSGALDQIAHRG